MIPSAENQRPDIIRLKDLIIFPRLGVTEWEKEGVQKVSLDLELFLDVEQAAREDRIGAAVDYSEVYGAVQEVAKVRKYHLIESLARSVVSAVLARFASVERVRVRLRKRNLPFDAHLECVEIELERGR